MRSIINHLIQLQELTLVRDEKRSLLGPKADLSELNEAIGQMADSLDPAAKAIYARLSKKDRIVVAPMHAGKCSMCGMGLAISQVQAVKQCKVLVTCPSCARILYDSDGPTWSGSRPRKPAAGTKAGIARFSSPELMIPDLKAKTEEEAIVELAESLRSAGFVETTEKLVTGAMAREKTFGTGVGHALAFPHVRGVEGGGLALAFGVSRAGIPWSGADGGVAKFVFFSAIPTATSVFYLKLLAGLAESYTKEANRKAALEADAPETLWKALAKATRWTVK